MNRLFNVIFGLAIATLFSLPTSAADREQTSSLDGQDRELIYCADLMTHAEREAYRERMRAARTPEEKAALREAHQEEMRARSRDRGINLIECEPQYQRERLRLRGGTP